jgi:hypothetical protein
MLEMWSVAKINRLTQKDVIDKNMASAMEINEANILKAEAAKFGFKKQMSIYGVLTNSVTHKSEYRRIEILSNGKYNSQDIELIYRFFEEVKPATIYTIWIYHKATESLALIGSFN